MKIDLGAKPYIFPMPVLLVAAWYEDEAVLDETVEIDPTRLSTVVCGLVRGGHYAVGEKIGQAWSTGLSLMK